jgi:putative Mg2+ transporter-C (MgtC) family protein
MVLPVPAHLSAVEHLLFSTAASKRLLVACALGGCIGIEREWRHKDAGLRTSMLICMGAALFTIMSAVLAGDATPDKSRVASNIVQGIGFLGAGLILHNKDRVLGMTSAATVFVVAAIGMTCGAGLYLTAAFATVIVLVALQVIGSLESKVGWRRYPMLYEVRAEVGAALPREAAGAALAEALAEECEAARHRMFAAILKVLDASGHRLQVLDRDNIAGMERVSFSLMSTRKEHARIEAALKASDATDHVVVFNGLSDE